MTKEVVKICRRKFLTIRVTRTEKAIIEDNARKAGTDISTYVRNKSLDGRDDSSSDQS